MTEPRCDDDFFCGECPDCLTGEDPANRMRLDTRPPMTEPLTPEEERLLRFARSINGGLADASPVETIDRLLATLDAARQYDDRLREAAQQLLEALADPLTVGPQRANAVAALRAALASHPTPSGTPDRDTDPHDPRHPFGRSCAHPSHDEGPGAAGVHPAAPSLDVEALAAEACFDPESCIDVGRLARAIHTASHIGDLHAAGEGWCGEEAAAIAREYQRIMEERG